MKASHSHRFHNSLSNFYHNHIRHRDRTPKQSNKSTPENSQQSLSTNQTSNIAPSQYSAPQHTESSSGSMINHPLADNTSIYSNSSNGFTSYRPSKGTMPDSTSSQPFNQNILDYNHHPASGVQNASQSHLNPTGSAFLQSNMSSAIVEDYNKNHHLNSQQDHNFELSPVKPHYQINANPLNSQYTTSPGPISTQESSPDIKMINEDNEGNSNSSGAVAMHTISLGFPNLGNTCYMNSMLQCLINTDRLYSYFIQGEHLLNANYDVFLSEAFGEVLSAAFSKRVRERDMCDLLREFKSTLEKVAPIFQGYNQNDAHEFFRLLIEKIHDELNVAPLKSSPYIEFKPPRGAESNPIAIAEAWKRYSSERESSVITSTFGGILLNEVFCTQCKHISYTFEESLDIPVNLPGSHGGASPPSLQITSLLSLMKQFTVWENVEGYSCPGCKRKETTVKKTTIWKQPEILVVQMKRFVYNQYGEREALHDKISFPFNNLSLDSFTHQQSNEPVKQYMLYGIVNHLGGIDSGHYISLIYNEHYKSWLQYNDDKVTKIDERDIRDFAAGSSEPYVLFYRRM